MPHVFLDGDGTHVEIPPANVSLGTRAFGSDPTAVARHAAALTRGLQEGGVVATPKHHVMLHYLLRRVFPGFQLKLGSAMNTRGWNSIYSKLNWSSL